MSKIGKKLISLPSNITIEQNNNEIVIKGPLGEMKISIPENFEVERSDNGLKIRPKQINKDTSALWGSYAAHLKNAVRGVATGFEKKLEVEGVGYRVEIQGKDLILNIGFSHPVKVPIPDDLKVETNKNTIIIKGINKERVGQYAAYIRDKRPPNVYKGYGIRYADEVIKLKAGKKLASSSGA